MQLATSFTATACAMLAAALALPAAAEEAAWSGDLGAGVSIARPIAASRSASTQAVPYANGDYGRFFARTDMFGARLLPAGYGSLELVGRYLGDGYTPVSAPLANPARRSSSVPIGFGTLQITPLGAVFANVYHDVNKSGGNLADLIYAAEFEAGPVTLYPELGLEYRNSHYVRYFYGVSPQEAAHTGLAVYRPQGALNVFGGLFFEAHIGGAWYLNGNWRRTTLDRAISASPLQTRRTAFSSLLAVSYRFQ